MSLFADGVLWYLVGRLGPGWYCCKKAVGPQIPDVSDWMSKIFWTLFPSASALVLLFYLYSMENPIALHNIIVKAVLTTLKSSDIVAYSV